MFMVPLSEPKLSPCRWEHWQKNILQLLVGTPTAKNKRIFFKHDRMNNESIHIEKPTLIKAEGNKIIEEFIGNVNTHTPEISIARMKSPPGWEEPPQQPEFDEYTLVLNGELQVETVDRVITVKANEAFIAKKGMEVRYSTPGPEGAEYIAVCLPAFSPGTVHRKE